ncbi:transglycosylase SLT domain-containing protein [Burkholderia vietnamiensis]|uniref:transglycosylase SLT domain-containing protein n=1 Tax=Burkholderia vietnamiensis TaxID=60552 RepID=UPI0018DD5D1D|nr:transglycosylase SLT domain-containing protein [Burkholderia vietnamiensis]
MADYSDLFAASGTQYAVPPLLLAAVQRTESGSGDNPAIVGPKPAIGGDDRAQGIMQIMGANAKAAGIDPTDPVQAVNWAAQNMAQLYKRYGNWDDVVRAYHGGTNTKNWGPRTNAYYQKVSANFQPGSATAQQAMPQNTQDAGLMDPFADAAPAAAQGPARAPARQPIASAQPQTPQLLDPFADAAPSNAPVAPAQPNAPQSHSSIAAFGAGLGHGFGSTVLGAQQLLGKGLQQFDATKGAGDWLVSDATQGAKNLDADYAGYQQTNPVAAGAGNIGGQVAPALLLPGGQAQIARIGSGVGRLAARSAVGAAQGSVMGATQPVVNDGQDFAQQKLSQIGAGAAGGALGAPVGAAIGRVLAPVGSAAVTALRNAGITPTIGQMLGPVASNLEQKATSLPLAGNLINSGRQQAVQQFNRAVGNDALAPIGETLPNNVRAGADMVQHVQQTIGQRYQDIARNGRVVMDAPLQKDIATLQAGIAQDAPALAGRFNNIVNNQLTGKNGGNLTGDQWASTRSMINQQIRNHSGFNASSDDRVMADYLQQLQDSITSNAEHYSAQSVQQQLGQANAAWARYKALEKAAGMKGAQAYDNVFTPNQYLSASRAGQTAAQRATSSSGQGFPAQNLAQTAQSVLGNTVPDSGTAGRLGVMDLLAGGGALANPATALKVGALALPYAPGVRNVMPALVASRPAAVRAAAPVARRLGPVIGGMLGTNSAQQPQQDQGVLSGLLSY